MNSKVYIIKQKANPLSYKELCYNLSVRYYVVGFQNLMHAKKIQYDIKPEPNLKLYRTEYLNIVSQVNKGLEEFGVDKINSHIVIDTMARLHVPKKNTDVYPSDHEMNDGGFHLSTVSYEDFLMYPFDNNVGIIMPHTLENETETEFVFTSNVVESTYSTDMFRKRLISNNAKPEKP